MRFVAKKALLRDLDLSKGSQMKEEEEKERQEQRGRRRSALGRLNS
jgi:hypothetical protein